jgi:hypothetical protein
MKCTVTPHPLRSTESSRNDNPPLADVGGPSHGGKMQIRSVRSLLGLLVAMVLATTTGLVVSSSPALAAGGGCRTWTSGAWTIQPCVSMENGILFADVYVSRAGGCPSGTICEIKVRLDEQQISTGQSFHWTLGYAAPRTGHHGPWTFGMATNARYRAYVQIAGLSCACYSPWIWR